MLKLLGCSIGRRAAEEVVTPTLIANAMADEWERMACDPRWSQHAAFLRAAAAKARLPSPTTEDPHHA